MVNTGALYPPETWVWWATMQFALFSGYLDNSTIFSLIVCSFRHFAFLNGYVG